VITVLNLFDILPGRHGDYANYLRGVGPLLARHGGRVICYGRTQTVYFGEAHQEFCGLVQYPSREAMDALSADADFRAIRPLRDDSTTNYVLSVIEDFDTMQAAIDFMDAGGHPEHSTSGDTHA
jgi:uncharacterized protein (DUF1330 family)